jgi:hypothetical protein
MSGITNRQKIGDLGVKRGITPGSAALTRLKNRPQSPAWTFSREPLHRSKIYAKIPSKPDRSKLFGEEHQTIGV